MFKRIVFVLALVAGLARAEDVNFTAAMVDRQYWPAVNVPVYAVIAQVPGGADEILVTIGVTVDGMRQEFTKPTTAQCSLNGLPSDGKAACFQPWIDAKWSPLRFDFIAVKVRRGSVVSSKRIEYGTPVAGIPSKETE